MKLVECRGKSFELYDVDECAGNDIYPISNWRNGGKGDWIKTADGKVMQVYGRTEKNTNTSKKPIIYIRTGYGVRPTYKKHIYASKQRDWHEDHYYKGRGLVNNVKPTELQKAFVDNLTKCGSVNEHGMWTASSIVDAYRTVYSDNNPTQALRRGMALLKRDYIRRRISMNMRDKFVDSGLDDDWVVEKYRSLSENVETPAATRLNAVNKVSELLGHNAKERTEEHTEGFIALSDGQIKHLAGIRKKFIEEEYVGTDNKKRNSSKDRIRNKQS